MQESVRIKEQEKSAVQENTTVETEVNKVAVVTMSAFGGVIGLWSLACIVSAMVQAGGPFKLISSWFGAVFGM